MRWRVGRLTAKEVANAKPRSGRLSDLLPDGGNLYLQTTIGVGGTINRSWLFRYEMHGKRHEMGLGSLRDRSLAEAREKARTLRQQLLDGIDPLQAKQEAREQVRKARLAERAEQARMFTFRQCAESYLAAHADSWKNAKHRWQWRTTLEEHAFPVIGDLAVSDIDTSHVVKTLEPIWRTIPETASRLRGRIERVLDWARVRGYRSGDNPARWRGHLAELLPSRKKIQKVRHHAALPIADLPGLMAELRGRDDNRARALLFTILCAARTSETLGALWSECDLKAKLWTIPAARMKSGREHRVPLSDRAVAILQATPHRGDHVFTGDTGRPLHPRAMADLLGELRPGYVPHGLRSTFRDWSSEFTNFPREVCELALAHSVGSEVEKAYRRGDLFAKRARLMEAWATFCANKPVPAEIAVLPLHGGHHA